MSVCKAGTVRFGTGNSMACGSHLENPSNHNRKCWVIFGDPQNGDGEIIKAKTGGKLCLLFPSIFVK